MQIAPLSLALALALALALSPGAPLWAQQTPAPPGDGRAQIEEGARLLLRGLMSEMEPTLQELGRALQELEPALRDLVETMGDLRRYEAPEVLPNGDILIRRKPDAPPPAGEIEI